MIPEYKKSFYIMTTLIMQVGIMKKYEILGFCLAYQGQDYSPVSIFIRVEIIIQ
jgi:hypothetical protein